MKKCDIVIPVYKSPEWVKLCVYSIFKNNDLEDLGKVYLINDCDDLITSNCLKNLKDKYKDKIEVINNEKNLGFIGSTNKGINASKSDYVLLLNTDCIVSKNLIRKMINNMEKDDSIGLICPISSNAANLSLPIFDGYTYNMMNELLEKKFSGMMFDACTVVGNCLMISRKCINEVGLLDEDYGMGYGEETDYQFKAMSKGFKAKVCIDTYVFHKAEVSFGCSKEKQERLNKNRELFFSRWGKEYDKLLKQYNRQDPIKYINDNLTVDDKKVNVDTVIYLDAIIQNAGGVHVVVDLINYLSINNYKANILYNAYGEYKEIMLFNPISLKEIDNINIKQIVSTIWSSTYLTYKISKEKKCKNLYFVQGNEVYFENGRIYGQVETTYKLADSILTISNYLKNELKNTHNVESTLINNCINKDLLYKKVTSKELKTITFVLRNNIMKGDWIILDILKKLDNNIKNYNFNVIYMNDSIKFPNIKNNKLNKYLGPLSRNEIFSILSSSDIYVDASLNEGFGLTPLEAIYSGNVPIVSNSFGNNDYIKDGYNGYLIDKVNNSSLYVSKIIELLNDNKKYYKLLENNKDIIDIFDIDNNVDKYIEYFNAPKLNKRVRLNNIDNENINYFNNSYNKLNKRRKMFAISRILPKRLKKKIKNIIIFMYNNVEH